jgi:hypothetical protein
MLNVEFNIQHSTFNIIGGLPDNNGKAELKALGGGVA